MRWGIEGCSGNALSIPCFQNTSALLGTLALSGREEGEGSLGKPRVGVSKRWDCGWHISPCARSAHAPSWSQCESGTSWSCPTTGGVVPAGTPAQRWAWQFFAFSRVTHSFTALGPVALCPWHAPLCPPQRLAFLSPVGCGPRHFCFLLSEVGSGGGETWDLLRARRGRTMASLWETPKLRHQVLN